MRDPTVVSSCQYTHCEIRETDREKQKVYSGVFCVNFFALHTLFSAFRIRVGIRTKSLKPIIHYSQTGRIGKKPFLSWTKYCSWKQGECAAIHCSLFAVAWMYSSLGAQTNFFFSKKISSVFVEETTTWMQIQWTVYGKKPVCETWWTPTIHYSLRILISSVHTCFVVVCK